MRVMIAAMIVARWLPGASGKTRPLPRASCLPSKSGAPDSSAHRCHVARHCGELLLGGPQGCKCSLHWQLKENIAESGDHSASAGNLHNRWSVLLENAFERQRSTCLVVACLTV